MAENTPTPESRQYAEAATRVLYPRLITGGLPDSDLVLAALQSAFTAGRKAGLREAESAARKDGAWLRNQEASMESDGAFTVADTIARLRSEGGGNG